MEYNTDWMDEVISVYEILEENAFIRMDNNLLFRNEGKIRLGSRILHSITKTLQTIRFALSHHSVSDAYVLLRKIRDDGLFFLILLELVEKYNLESLTRNYSHTPGSLTEDEIAAWFESGLGKTKKISYRAFKGYFGENEVISTFIDMFYEKKLKKWDRILNDHVHGNSYLSYCENDNYNGNLFDEIRETAFGLTSFLLSVLILVDPSYIASSDYSDYISAGLTPPVGCQYLVAPVFTDYMQRRMQEDEVEYLRKHQKYDMLF